MQLILLEGQLFLESDNFCFENVKGRLRFAASRQRFYDACQLLLLPYLALVRRLYAHTELVNR